MTTHKEDQMRAEFEDMPEITYKTRIDNEYYQCPVTEFTWRVYKACAESYEKKLAEKDAEIEGLQAAARFWQDKAGEANARNAMLVELLKMTGGGECTCKDERPCYGCRVQKIIDEAIAAESYEKKLAEVQIAILEKAATMLDTRHLELIQKAKLPSQLVMELVEELRASNKGKE